MCTNFTALKHLSICIIIAFSAVGSLHEIAQSTCSAFGTHRSHQGCFSNPSSSCLTAWLADTVQALKAKGRAVKLWTKKMLGVMEGLQFSMHAESLIYHQ
ncbi:hypothetical protein MVEN_00309400 [Mycena venus]|uniref:Secreted protein n=1 Tax=Mycena venus TaxID=2733690 RepID=A0A8H6Z082_9AGAR|nr:hypothetical protein MVEN_00309400 [Mycena venus]